MFLTQQTNQKKKTKSAIKADENEKITKPVLDNNKTTIREQLDNNKTTIREQLDNNKTTIREQLDNELDNKALLTTYKETIYNLSGLQEKIFFFILELCCQKGETSTGALKTEQLALSIGCSYNTLKMSLKRLIDKALVKRNVGRRAKGGFINLEIDKAIRTIALLIKNEKKLSQYDLLQADINKITIREQLDNELDNNTIYSSSNIYKNTTTTGELPEEWRNIDFSLLQHIGFSENQLKQLFEKKLNAPEIIQESIYHFAFGLQNNPKFQTYKDPLNVFMGVLRQGNAWIESTYVSPHVRALKEQVERKRAEQQEKERLEKELMILHANEWMSELSDEEKEKILPASKVYGPKEAYFRDHFEKNIWPEKKKQINL